MLLSDFLRKLGLNFYIMNNAKIKVIMIFLCNRNQNLIETALILPDIFPIVNDKYMHFALFVTKLFSFRHKGTKTPKNNNKILWVFVTL